MFSIFFTLRSLLNPCTIPVEKLSEYPGCEKTSFFDRHSNLEKWCPKYPTDCDIQRIMSI